ncbi:MAG TPA: thioredoxin [Bacilli bacterium]|jgi:thioredoxin 1|nr:thioredoxin [Bacilli bacterium]HQC83456.1 thioredoxin [Bacilli bacterium]
MIELKSSNFNDEISKGKVLVDFNATWCGPCKMMAPILEATSGEVKDIKFTGLDIDDNEDIAIKYNVMSIPTLILFVDGKEIKRSVGLISHDELIDFLK